MMRLVSRRAVLAAFFVVSLAGSASAQTDPRPGAHFMDCHHTDAEGECTYLNPARTSALT